MAERANIYVKLKNFQNALDTLLPLANFYEESGWTALIEWVLLRISFCFHQLGNRTLYFQSLLSFFPPSDATGDR